MGKVLVTGHSGYIGRVLCNRLRDYGEDIVGYSRRSGGDIRNIAALDKALTGCDTVYHLAAKVSFNEKDRGEAYDINVIGTNILLNLAAKHKVKRVVVAGSAITCGVQKSPKNLMDENTSLKIGQSKVNPYVWSKFVCEQVVRTAEVDTVLVCPTNCRTDLFVRQVYEDPVIYVTSGGTNMIGVKDVAEGMIQAMALGKPKEKYILSAVNIPFVEIYRKIIRLRERIYPHTYRIPKIVKLPKILKGVCTGAAAFSKDEFINPYIVAAAFHYKYYTHRKAQEHLRFSPDLLLEEPIMDEIYGRIRNE